MLTVLPSGSGQSNNALTSVADRWYMAFDNQRLNIGGCSWVVQVDGIHSQDDELWIQLTRQGFDDRGLVLHISRGVDIDEAIKLLASRSGDLQPGEVIEVAPFRAG